MATNDELLFEIERRSVIFHALTTMPDGSQLGYTGDPNLAVLGNTDGEDLIYNCPSGSVYHDKTITQEDIWEKVVNIAGGLWVKIESSAGSDIALNTTILNVTATKASGSNFFVDSGGTDYTKSRDNGNLLANALAFLDNEKVQIFLNGNNLQKGSDVIWTSPVSFNFNFGTDNGDVIKVIS